MEFKANVTNIRMSPRKVRKIADLVRGLPVARALAQLEFSPHKAAVPVKKLVKSAIANAEHNFDADGNNLFIQKIWVNAGPTYKRYMPRSQGRAFGILKRTSKIDIVLGELNPTKKKKKAVKKEMPETVKIDQFAKMEAAKKQEEKDEKKNQPVDAAAKKDVKEVAAQKRADLKRTFFRRKGDA